MNRCPGCGGKKLRRFYVCGTCWHGLRPHVRRALNRRDPLAARRLGELYRQIQQEIPLSEIEVTP